MGQYHAIFNLTKKEFLNPRAFRSGAKLMEFGASGHSTMLALAILLAVSDGRGGGDFSYASVRTSTTSGVPFSNLVGRWGGDRIAIIGDYSRKDDLPTDLGMDAEQVYRDAENGVDGWTNISEHVAEMMRLRVEDEDAGESYYDGVLDKFIPT